MAISIVHLSDIHYRNDWEEEQGVVFKEFFKDLEKQISTLDKSSVFIALSGDFVQNGSDKSLFDGFYNYFDNKLNNIGISKNHRICVPGNHDISRDLIKKNIENHEALISKNLPETKFNDYISNLKNNVLLEKFRNYKAFETKFSDYCIKTDSMSGMGWTIADNIGLYCLNSALCSSGGLDIDGSNIEDEGRLAIDTRSLHLWNQTTENKNKILVMHHPLDSLTDWSKKELRTLINSDFCLLLSGHDHNQELYHSINNDKPLIECSAPPLLTNKEGDLGYSMVLIDSKEGVTEIVYRQWTKFRSFVTGVNFSNTDNGKINLKPSLKQSSQSTSRQNFENENITKSLTKYFTDSLITFNNQPIIWIKPILHTKSELSIKGNSKLRDESPVNLQEIIQNPKSLIIKALPQFGLTCLSRFLCKEAWEVKKEYWLYLDARILETHTINKFVSNELSENELTLSDVKCVILDSWSLLERKSLLLLQKISDLFINAPVIVMQTIDDSQFLEKPIPDISNRNFEVLYLWSQPRTCLRSYITEYNDQKHIGEIDSILSKVIADLDVLNLPRTPLNCLTLLKASEIDFDESPVNRTEMIKRILFLLFNSEDIPTYKTKPDLKDCEYILGYFCEILIKNDIFMFTRDFFLENLTAFCETQIIDLEVEVVFDVLQMNHIIIRNGNSFCFRFIYWIYYFAAQRMHQNSDFASYILSDMRYVSFPEIIEFYTGIDRRREDALTILLKDITTTSNSVKEKCGFPEGLDIYRLAQWNPTETSIKKMQLELSDGVNDSKLPDEVKDQFADRNYDQEKPYYQEIHRVLEEYSFLRLEQTMKAGARALRNSDYVNPELKNQLLVSITVAWEHITKVLFVISPILAEKLIAMFDGSGFLLVGDFGDTPVIRFNNILCEIPNNILAWYKDDLYSRKMGPLLINQYNKEIIDLRKHYLIRLLINQRPRNWKTIVQQYIESIPKNSFYLLDIKNALYLQYMYSFVSPRTLNDLKYLLKMTLAKHQYGMNRPSNETINRVPDNILPTRDPQ